MASVIAGNASNTITTLYKSRFNLLNLLKAQGYDISDYSDFGINEVHAMNTNKQLDMLLTAGENLETRKTYVKYHLGKPLRRENLNDYIDDLFNLEQVLTKNDNLIIIMKQDVNDTIINMLNQLYDNDGIFVIIFSLDQLQFNILEHSLVPKHSKCSETEMNDIMKKYNISDVKMFPDISRYDPAAKAIGLRPGELCKIERSSKTSISSTYYRFCTQ